MLLLSWVCGLLRVFFLDVASPRERQVLNVGLIVVDGYGERLERDGSVDDGHREIADPVGKLIGLYDGA